MLCLATSSTVFEVRTVRTVLCKKGTKRTEGKPKGLGRHMFPRVYSKPNHGFGRSILGNPFTLLNPSELRPKLEL